MSRATEGPLISVVITRSPSFHPGVHSLAFPVGIQLPFLVPKSRDWERGMRGGVWRGTSAREEALGGVMLPAA